MPKPKPLPDERMVRLALDLKGYRFYAEQSREQAKQMEAKAEVAERELVDRILEVFGEDGGNSFDISDKFKAILSARTHVSIKPGWDDIVHGWLRAHGYADSIQPYISQSDFECVLRKIAEGKGVDVKDLCNDDVLINAVKTYVEKRISFRQLKSANRGNANAEA